jgi:sterol desaturase/sphingolipid hydroxylase (fatty acid hydroxylase superfamily)
MDKFITAFGAMNGFQAAITVFVAALSGFLVLYFSAAGITWLLTRRLLPALGIGVVVDQRPLRDSQIGREIARSLITILVFGVYGLVTFLAWRVGLVSVDLHASWPKILFDVVLLMAWNEVHFYCLHRLLHTRWLYRHVHRIHHESVAPTPFPLTAFIGWRRRFSAAS